jgi:hypothetical protein
MAVIIFSPSQNLISALHFIRPDLWSFYSRALYSDSHFFWKGQRDTAAAGFNSDHRMEDFRLNDLLCRSNRKCDLDLVFNLYGPSSNLYRCDSESGLF